MEVTSFTVVMFVIFSLANKRISSANWRWEIFKVKGCPIFGSNFLDYEVVDKFHSYDQEIRWNGVHLSNSFRGSERINSFPFIKGVYLSFFRQDVIRFFKLEGKLKRLSIVSIKFQDIESKVLFMSILMINQPSLDFESFIEFIVSWVSRKRLEQCPSAK